MLEQPTVKIRTMEDDLKTRFQSVGPSSAVEVTGLNSVPKAGDVFMVFEDERVTRQIAEEKIK